MDSGAWWTTVHWVTKESDTPEDTFPLPRPLIVFFGPQPTIVRMPGEEGASLDGMEIREGLWRR